MDASYSATGGRCTEADCMCLSFSSNLYRPALCTVCYHSIAEHFPDQWTEVLDSATGKVYYQHARSSARLYAKPYDPSAGTTVLNSLSKQSSGPSSSQKLSRAALEPFSSPSAGGEGGSASADNVLPARTRQLVAFVPVPVGSADTTAMLLPSATPCAVPQCALENLSLDVSLLSTQQSSEEKSLTSSIPLSSVSLLGSETPLAAAGTQKTTVRSDEAAYTRSPVEGSAISASSLSPGDDSRSIAIVDPAIAAFLQPLYEDPLLVIIDAAAFAPGGHKGVSAFRMEQPFNEHISVPRVLVLTPFSVMSLAPHPSRVDVWLLCWERSLLSLIHLATQPLYSVSVESPSGTSAEPPRTGLASWLFGSKKTESTGLSGATGERHSVMLQPDASQVASAVGVLASFAPETEDTVAFLRVWRAGRQSASKRGFLLKRKKSGWREHAPLGPLAWKRRFFVLGRRAMPYYSRSSASGDPVGLKGSVPLDGW
jgi:hypothetical protein